MAMLRNFLFVCGAIAVFLHDSQTPHKWIVYQNYTAGVKALMIAPPLQARKICDSSCATAHGLFPGQVEDAIREFGVKAVLEVGSG